MKILLALGIMIFASVADSAANAATSGYSDLIVVSVIPRSPKVQPIVMSIPAREERKSAPLPAGPAGPAR